MAVPGGSGESRAGRLPSKDRCWCSDEQNKLQLLTRASGTADIYQAIQVKDDVPTAMTRGASTILGFRAGVTVRPG